MSQKLLPSQRLFKSFEERIILGELALTDVLRLGSHLMLQHAVEIEMREFLGRDYYQNNPEVTEAKGRRNGYEKRTVLSGEGAIEVEVPQVRDLPDDGPRFRSSFLEEYARRSETIDQVVTRMYVAGMSTRDIEDAFMELFSARGVSRSTVSLVTERLNEDLEAFRKRDLSEENILYLFLDGTYLKYRVESDQKEPVLVAYGIREDGHKVLLHVGPGNRESYQNWKTFLHEMTSRGLKTPLLVVTDGNPGVMKAVEEVFPVALRQRCQKHKMNNILGKAPKEASKILKEAIHKAFHAKSYEEGLRIAREVIEKFRDRFPAAMACLEQDLEACLQCLRFPKEHHKRIRTTNLLERLFGENRRRVKVIPHFFDEKAGMKLVYATLIASSKKWRGVRMTPLISKRVDDLWKEVFGETRQETWAA